MRTLFAHAFFWSRFDTPIRAIAVFKRNALSECKSKTKRKINQKMSRLALEELEARCDQLQRRMPSSISNSNNPVSGKTSSPARGGRAGSAPIASSTSSALSQMQTSAALAAAPSVLSGATVLPPQPYEISQAVQHLEKEKQRLEAELKLVNTHLQTYRYLMRMPTPLPSASTGLVGAPHRSTTPTTSSMSAAPVASTTHSSVTFLDSPRRPDRALHSPAYRAAATTATSAAANAAASFTPASGGAALSFAATPSSSLSSTAGSHDLMAPSAMGNDQIADELRKIRRAREEREAQRRLSATIQSGGSPSRF